MSDSALLAELELGSSYRLVERVQAPHLFAYRELDPLRVVVADSNEPLFEVEGTGRFVWGPYGDHIYIGGRHVRRFDLQTRVSETVLELAESDGAPGFAISPDEEDLVFLHEVEPAEIAAISEYVPEVPVRRGAGLSSVSAYSFGFVSLFHGRRSQTHIKGRRGRLLGVCWEQEIAAVSFREHRTALLPPEALDGEPFDQRGDLFALGVVLYQSVTGKAPFTGRNLSETIRKTFAGRVPPMSSFDADASPELEAIVIRLLSTDPEERPADALELATVLDAFVPAQPALWRPKFVATGPEPEEDYVRPKSHLLPSARIEELAEP